MFEKDNEVKFVALRMWANHIETGDVSISAEDAYRMNKKASIKYLDEDQKKFVIRLRELADKEMAIGLSEPRKRNIPGLPFTV